MKWYDYVFCVSMALVFTEDLKVLSVVNSVSSLIWNLFMFGIDCYIFMRYSEFRKEMQDNERKSK